MSVFSKKWLGVLAVAPCACSASASMNGAKAGDGGTMGDTNSSQDDSADGASLADGAAEGSSSGDAGAGGDEPVPFDTGGSPGHVVVQMPGGDWHRFAASASPADEDLANVLNALSPGSDQYVNLSLDGAWLALNSGRFGCTDSNCVVLVKDVSKGEILPIVRTEGRPTVAPGGNVVVYPSDGGPHSIDVYSIRRSGGGWGAPLLLSASMPAPYAHDVAFSFDGTRVVFDCGPSQYQDAGTSICEAAVDGSDFRVVVGPADGPQGTMANETHHPAYAPDGSIVFEADWQGAEEVWRIAASGGAPVKISPPGVTDDNSPCVLPDGRIASLWLGRPGNVDSIHELKVMNADGTGAIMLVTGVDIVDVGESCGN